MDTVVHQFPVPGPPTPDFSRKDLFRFSPEMPKAKSQRGGGCFDVKKDGLSCNEIRLVLLGKYPILPFAICRYYGYTS